jgi:hypothetical protein
VVHLAGDFVGTPLDLRTGRNEPLQHDRHPEPLRSGEAGGGRLRQLVLYLRKFRRATQARGDTVRPALARRAVETHLGAVGGCFSICAV